MRTGKRRIGIQLLLTLIGVTAFCVYSHSWFDATHLLYDIPAGLCTFAFIAQLVLDTFGTDRFNAFWFHRILMVLAMTAATVGRQYWDWTISGHLTCVLSIAFVQTGDLRLPALERIAYWIPVLTVLYLRLALLEHGGHSATYAALAFALAWGIPGMLVAWKQSRHFESAPPRYNPDEFSEITPTAT